jgi:hypothetical protein
MLLSPYHLLWHLSSMAFVFLGLALKRGSTVQQGMATR